MKLVAISDVHVKENNDEASRLLISFLRNPEVRSADVIFLLGDIFDLMIGPLSQYFFRFSDFFIELRLLLLSGKKICYVEGNHDFHIDYLYKKFFKVHHDLNKELFQIAPHFEVDDNGKKIYLCHGDDIELGNPGYKIFKKTVRSYPISLFANYFMPHFLIKNVGEYSSAQSRKRNNKRYSKDSDLMPVLENFRYSIDVFHKKQKANIYVLGHSHVKDLYNSANGFTYVNNGYANHSKTFILIENGNVSFQPIL